MADSATWQARKDEAELALHRLATGAAVEEIAAPDGSRTRFGPGDMTKLQEYIKFCDQQIAQATTGNRRPIYFVGGR
jgi:hypothetical protein